MTIPFKSPPNSLAVAKCKASSDRNAVDFIIPASKKVFSFGKINETVDKTDWIRSEVRPNLNLALKASVLSNCEDQIELLARYHVRNARDSSSSIINFKNAEVSKYQAKVVILHFLIRSTHPT